VFLKATALAAIALLLNDLGSAQAVGLQRAVDGAMRGHRGSVVVLDVPSGHILAAHNLTGAARRVARPGSAVKPFTLRALISSGAVDPAVRFACRRNGRIAGHKIDCGHPVIPGGLDAIDALAYSCNDYFTSMALRLLPAQLQQAFLQAGLTGPSGLVGQEARGYVGLAAGESQLQLQAIGEEDVRTTPLALLKAYRELALRRRNATIDAADHTVFAGLEAATEYGMARLAQPASTLKVAGKTGTSLADEGHWKHGWFAGFAPATDPQIVLVVFLEQGTGPADAAPIAGKVFAAYAAGAHP
jgi:penicillin-binding protein 2